MKNPLFLKVILSVILAVVSQTSNAQTFLGTPWTQSSPSVTTGVDTFGTFISTAPLNNAVTFNSTESSTASSTSMFLWVPALGSLRIGAPFTAPTTTNMGYFSFAFGQVAFASGQYSAAIGFDTNASGGMSIAFQDLENHH